VLASDEVEPDDVGPDDVGPEDVGPDDVLESVDVGSEEVESVLDVSLEDVGDADTDGLSWLVVPMAPATASTPPMEMIRATRKCMQAAYPPACIPNRSLRSPATQAA
jgi:hypothetical protein